MGNAYSTPFNQKPYSGSPPVRGDEDADRDAEVDVASMLAENARLRALVVQLSDLVLRNVVGQK